MIKFPQVHIAESVVNRILATADELRSQRAVSQPAAPVVPDPVVPDPSLQGQQLDVSLATPAPDMPAAPIAEPNTAGAVEAAMQGGSLIDGLMSQ